MDEAVGTAMRLFWTRGYQKTTMSDLERAMRIGRASVYAAFPDKETMFLRALERYRADYTLPSLALLEEDRPPLEALGALFDRLAARYAGPDTPPGCLVVLNAGHLGADSPKALEALAASVAHGEAKIADTLRRAVDAGDVRPDARVEALARFLVAATQGMATMARLGRSEADMRGIGRTALSVLSAFRGSTSSCTPSEKTGGPS